MAAELATGLLEGKEHLRLGCTSEGFLGVANHPYAPAAAPPGGNAPPSSDYAPPPLTCRYFASLDWLALFNQQLEPPHIPDPGRTNTDFSAQVEPDAPSRWCLPSLPPVLTVGGVPPPPLGAGRARRARRPAAGRRARAQVCQLWARVRRRAPPDRELIMSASASTSTVFSRFRGFSGDGGGACDAPACAARDVCVRAWGWPWGQRERASERAREREREIER